jgi:lipopolysaccharide transport system ATP-binding protein
MRGQCHRTFAWALRIHTILPYQGKQMSSEIRLVNATVQFRIYRNPSPSLQETFIDSLSRKKKMEVVEFDVLKKVSVVIKGGDRLGVIGLNGAGKSTFLKTIVGIYPLRAGFMSIRGKITPMIELGAGFDMELSGRENIYLNGAMLGRSQQQMQKVEEEIISFSGLGEKIDIPIKYYSSGMYSRLAFSIGAITDPEILLLDEIFAAGDAQFVNKAMSHMLKLIENSPIVVLVSHDLQQIHRLCNRVIVLHRGQIVKQGSPSDAVSFYQREIAQVEANVG